MLRRFSIFVLALFALVASPDLVLAHDGHVHSGGGFVSGFTHPLTGLDHLIAMLGIGVWAAQVGGRAVVTLPAVFVSMMLVGGVLALSGVDVPLIEPGIITSLLVLGLIIAAAAKLPLAAGVCLTALFALFHGAAHGQELGAASPISFALGAMCVSGLLHLAGAIVGGLFNAKVGAVAVRLTGGVIAATALLMMVGVL